MIDMKRILLFFSLIIFVVSTAYSQGLNANLAFARFYNPEQGSYLETYLSVETKGLVLQPTADGHFVARVNVLLLIKQNDSIIDFSKTQLQSPKIEDSIRIDFNFIDQQRFFLPNGDYELELEMVDAHTDMEPLISVADFSLHFSASDSVQISDVEFLSSYKKSSALHVNTKNGFDMVPRVSNFFVASSDTMIFYNELYNLKASIGDNADFLANVYITEFNRTEVASDLFSRQRMKAQDVNVLLNKFDLSALPSGNYLLHIDLRDKTNKPLAKSQSFFQVSNPQVSYNDAILARIEANSYVKQMSEDTLTQYIKSLAPIAEPNEALFIDKALEQATLDMKQKFFSHFWAERDRLHPQEAWMRYALELKKVDNSFGSPYMAGYNTDRGRVYLKYGPPNTIVDRVFDTENNRGDGGSVPYQIWHYYTIGTQGDCKFVFYNPHMVHNNYQLLHSNVIGEIHNPHWQTFLQRGQIDYIDRPEHDVYEGGTGEYYNNPF